MNRNDSKYFNNPLLSDCTLEVIVADDSSSKLVYHGHKLVLFKHFPELEASPLAGAVHPTFTLTIKDASLLQAAEYVLADVYGAFNCSSRNVKGPDMLRYILLADSWGLDNLASAMCNSVSACCEHGSLEAIIPILTHLFDMPSWDPILLPVLPDALKAMDKVEMSEKHQLMERMLITIWGDLEQVWGSSDTERRSTMWKLAPSVMARLLGSDQLAVAREDTVLYTTTMYCKHHSRYRNLESWQMEWLMQAVRFPQLSPSCLATLVHELAWLGVGSTYSRQFIKREQLLLASLLQSSSNGALGIGKSSMPQHIKDATQLLAGSSKLPFSWFLGPRTGVTGVERFTSSMVVDVNELKSLVHDASQCEDGSVLKLYNHEGLDRINERAYAGYNWIAQLDIRVVMVETPSTTGGLAEPVPSTLGATIAADPLVFANGHEAVLVKGVQIGASLRPFFASGRLCEESNVLWEAASVSMSCCGHSVKGEGVCATFDDGWGTRDLFKLGPMVAASGWNDVAWAAGGLPAEGSLVLRWDIVV